MSRRMFEAKRSSGFRPRRAIHLGYFSGTPTHDRDFECRTARYPAARARSPARVAGRRHPRARGALLRHRDRLEYSSAAGLPQPPAADRGCRDQHGAASGQPLHQLQVRAEVLRGRDLSARSLSLRRPSSFATPCARATTATCQAHEWEAKRRGQLPLSNSRTAYAAIVERCLPPC